MRSLDPFGEAPPTARASPTFGTTTLVTKMLADIGGSAAFGASAQLGKSLAAISGMNDLHKTAAAIDGLTSGQLGEFWPELFRPGLGESQRHPPRSMSDVALAPAAQLSEGEAVAKSAGLTVPTSGPISRLDLDRRVESLPPATYRLMVAAVLCTPWGVWALCTGRFDVLRDLILTFGTALLATRWPSDGPPRADHSRAAPDRW